MEDSSVLLPERPMPTWALLTCGGAMQQSYAHYFFILRGVKTSTPGNESLCIT